MQSYKINLRNLRNLRKNSMTVVKKTKKLRGNRKKVSENLRDKRKSRNFAPAFRRNRCCLGRSVARPCCVGTTNNF